MNGARYQRGVLLYQQSRYEQAADEFRAALAEQPEHAPAHAYLALCHLERERFDEAERAAEAAIARDPEWAFAHYARSRVLHDRGRLEPALAALDEALRLDPDEPFFRGFRASLLLQLERREEALAESERGLALDPENVTCQNLRSLALTKLNRRAEAAATLDAALARRPDDALTHANLGWAHLHSNRPKEALASFREALRLAPELDWAREGLVEALKARNPLYRGMLAYFLWLSRLSPRTRLAVIFGALILARVLRVVSKSWPAAEPWIVPLLLLYALFVVMTWIAEPLADLALLLHRDGRLALSTEQRRYALAVGGWLALALLAVPLALLVEPRTLGVASIGIAALVIPTAAIRSCSEGWPRKLMLGYTALLALGVLSLAAFGFALHEEGFAIGASGLGFLGALLSTWLGLGLSRVRTTR